MAKKIKTSEFTSKENKKFQELEEADRQAKADHETLKYQSEHYNRDTNKEFPLNDPSLTGKTTASDYTYDIENKDLKSQMYSKIATDIVKRKMKYLKNIQEKLGDDAMVEEVDNLNQYSNIIQKLAKKK